MIVIDVPGSRRYELRHLVLDYNGTLAVDGVPIDGVAEALQALAAQVEIVVVTADTFGRAAEFLGSLPVTLLVAPASAQDLYKLDVVHALGAAGVVAIGNGRNDRLLLRESALGIAVVQREGAAVESCRNADVVCTSILDALALLREPRRLVATLRI